MKKVLAFLKGNAPLNVRKNEKKDKIKKIGENKMSNGNYTVVVDGQRFNVSVFEGDVQNIQVAQPVQQVVQQAPVQAPAQSSSSSFKTCLQWNRSNSSCKWKCMENTC
jgi:pyruvate carboxylase subunit B